METWELERNLKLVLSVGIFCTWEDYKVLHTSTEGIRWPLDAFNGSEEWDLTIKIIIIIIIITINCNRVVTRLQWLYYKYTKYEIGY